jgi:hypothetical protein
MKTVVIWDMMGQEPIQYFVVTGDWSRFNHLYINTYTDKTPKGESGNMLQTLLSDFPIEEVKDGAQVIVCGFLP